MCDIQIRPIFLDAFEERQKNLFSTNDFYRTGKNSQGNSSPDKYFCFPIDFSSEPFNLHSQSIFIYGQTKLHISKYISTSFVVMPFFCIK